VVQGDGGEVSVYRQIHTRIWQDAWFLDLLPEEKLLFIYLFSNEHAALCGLYELPLKTMSFETGLRTDAITLALHRFQEAGKAFHEAPYVWVPNLRKYNESTSPKVAAKITSELADVPDCNLKRAYVGYYATGAIVAAYAPDVAVAPPQPLSIPYPENLAKRDKNKNSNPPTDKERRSRIPAEYPSSQAFRDIVHRWPVKSLQADMHAVVGSDPEAVELWRKVVRAWIGLGWNPMNTDGMLEFFKRKEIPRLGKPGESGQAKMTDKQWLENLRSGTLPVEPEPFIPPNMRGG
jgi:hypothetical protein